MCVCVCEQVVCGRKVVCESEAVYVLSIAIPCTEGGGYHEVVVELNTENG